MKQRQRKQVRKRVKKSTETVVLDAIDKMGEDRIRHKIGGFLMPEQYMKVLLKLLKVKK